jgi:hypothetical protein
VLNSLSIPSNARCGEDDEVDKEEEEGLKLETL